MIILELTLFILFISWSHCKHPDKVYCANEKCDEPISKARTLLSYNSPDPDLISFRGNSEAIVYMKSAGTNPELWYAHIGEKVGFVNSNFLRENKIIERSPKFIVLYEAKLKESVQPNKVQQAHEVFEGTTIYTSETAVNTSQNDATTQVPSTTSNEDTPSLEESIEKFVETISDTSQNIESNDSSGLNDNMLDAHQNSEENTNSNIETSETLIKSTETAIVTEEINIVKTPDEIPLDDTNTAAEINTESNDAIREIEQEASTQQVLQTDSGSINTEPVLNVPENQELKVIKESEDTASKEATVLLNRNHEDKIQIDQNTSSENSNVANESVNMANILIVEQTQDIPNHGIGDNISNMNAVQSNNINNNAQPVTDTLPAIESPNKDTPSIPPEETLTSTESPSSELPVRDISTSSPPLITTDTIPAFYPADSHTLAAPGTIPPVMNIEQSTPETPHREPQVLLPNTETITTMPFYSTEQTISEQNNLESVTSQEQYYPSQTSEEYTASNEQHVGDEVTSTTETPTQDENTEGLFSNMYSSVADMWPSTTEEPPIYNTEDYPTYENDRNQETEGFSFMKYLITTYYTVMGTSEESKALFTSVGETCYTDEYCDGTSHDGSNRLLTFLLTTATSVLLFTLGYYYIDNRRQDGRLIGQINSLQRDLLFTTKECEILKEQLSTTKNKLAGIEDSSFGMDEMVQSLREEINELKVTNERLRNSLDDNEKLLRVSENTAGELQNTLSEVENTLSELLAERANSEDQIVELNGKVQAFEEELISVSRERDNFQLKYVSAESALEELKKQKKHLEDVTKQLSESKNTIDLQRHEINALKEAIKDLKSGIPSNVDASSLIDHTEIKAKLSKALEERKDFETKYETEHKERVRLTEELQTTQETLNTSSQNATEALTRLDVLGKYFQERESELMKELNAKESLWLSKQSESATTVEKIELLQQEIQRYKEKCDALTLELAEQESSRRTALSAVEARAHSAWLEARAARRDADAARDDAAALRRRLAALSACAPADGALSPHRKVASPLDNLENPVIPPPLPPMFLPPPLLPPLPRPPPLGRLPSPHPPRYADRRYSPDSRYSPERRYSPDSRYSPETVRYSPESRYSPRSRRSAYSPRSRRRSRSRERYEGGRSSRTRNGPADTETEYNSDSPSREPRRRSRYSRHSGPSSGSGCSSESDK